MLDGIRMKIMKMASARRMECKNWKSFLCPKIEAKFLERTEKARSVTVTKSDDHVFEVDTEKHKHRVELLRRDCTCNKWGIDGASLVALQPGGLHQVKVAIHHRQLYPPLHLYLYLPPCLEETM
ncbi:hypothetical protein IFM89_029272 [Coptis chinensis]|uniref:Uncharacterized protein n=1 Tax=Coptis chinensis TaxID=261450 RepID=A0A835HTS5_9MAGN|nr:hypothetical protein IFM89_029272 [Coptis chinensis]